MTMWQMYWITRLGCVHSGGAKLIVTLVGLAALILTVGRLIVGADEDEDNNTGKEARKVMKSTKRPHRIAVTLLCLGVFMLAFTPTVPEMGAIITILCGYRTSRTK